MGNQQVNLFIATAWLAGMIDADGCISYSDKGGRGNQIVPLIDIASSCRGTTTVLYKTVKMIGGAAFITRQYKQTGTYTTRVSGYKRVATFLPKIIPFLVTKKEEAEKMLKFVNIRLNQKTQQQKRKISDKRGRNYEMMVNVKPFTDEAKRLHQEIKDIKINRSLRDYNPDVLWLQGEDIVRTHDESVRDT